MSKKEKGISEYQYFILIAPLLNYKITNHHKKKKFYQIVTPDGEIKDSLRIHASAVKSLISKGYLYVIDINQGKISLTSKGFDVATERIEKAGCKLWYN